MNKLFELNIKMKSISVFRNLLTQSLFIRLQYLLDKSQENKIDDMINAYSSFVCELYGKSENLSKVIFQYVNEDENIYVLRKAGKLEVGKNIEEAIVNELQILEALSRLKPTDFAPYLDKYSDILGKWDTSEIDFLHAYKKRIEEISKFGYGIYAKYHVFNINNEGDIVPVKYPDPQKLSDFSSYERERKLVVQNTLTLLNGDKASNALLYGDAGTGKSSTIKAIANEYKKDGLRLIEVKKQQLFQIPEILEILSTNPLKFIIFIDDLSFVSNDENFAALKSILEGGVSAIGKNVVIYATSNRRHLVKEDHQSRMGDEVHLQDTLQETMSLSSRFALCITFNRPQKDTFLQIVKDLAKQYKIEVNDQLFIDAEAYAIRHHGRSPRTAKQFIELLKAGI